MKKQFLMLILAVFTIFTVNAQDSVNWYTEYDKALEAAEAEGKNIFVLITAPSWCIWCTRLEENVLSKPNFQKYQTENFISLMLLDKIDGKRNPELDNFDFSGYPSVFLYDYEGRFIKNIYTQDPDTMLASMSRYKEAEGEYRPLLKDLQLPEKYTYGSNGVYINNGNKTWTDKNGDGETLYRQTKYDFDYIYLELMGGDPEKVHVIALPMNGTDRHMANQVNNEWIWSDLEDVEKVGGDPFFD